MSPSVATKSVLMIAPEPFFEPRGTPISVYQRLQALSALGYNVDLVTYHVGVDVHIPNVRVHRIPPIPFVKKVKTGPSWIKPVLDSLVFIQTTLLLCRRRYDVIHSHEEAAFFAQLLANLFRTRHLYDMHSSLPQQLRNFGVGNYWPLIKLFALLERWVLQRCDAVIVIGSDLEAYVKDINPNVQQSVIGNIALHTTRQPTEVSTFQHLKNQAGLDSRQLVVYTGSLERYQGIGLLLESAEIVRKDNPKVTFILAGGSPEQIGRWQIEVRRRRLEDCIHLVGIMPPEDALALMSVADVLVSPRTEGTSVPLKIYSYLHAGTPIVATHVPAHTQVLSNEVACLTEPTSDAFARAIVELLGAPELRQRLGEAARQLAAKRYGFDRYQKKIEELYADVLPAAGSGQVPDAAAPLLD